MRHLLAATALLAGCSFPHGKGGDAQQDAPRVIDGPSIDTSVVNDGPSDGPIDSPPTTTDTDGDGVADTSDNCPLVANTDQRDHDADLHGDVCDHCPHLASTADPDGDADGVGDACDPHPSTAGDAIALFEGFYDATSINGWTEAGNGTWSVANGVLTQSSTTTSTTTNALGPTLSVARATVTAGATVIALGNATNGGENPHVSVSAGVTQNQSYWCSVVDEGNNDKLYASVFRQSMFPSFPNTDWSGTFAATSQLRISLALLGSNNECTVLQGTTNGTVSGNTGTTTGRVQVATRTASASFDYLFVVSMP